MDQFTPEQIQERFNKLPAELQAALSSEQMAETIRKIGKDNDLMIDQIGEIVDQVGLVVLGLAKPLNFVTDIQTRIGASAGTAKRIADQINT